jgi:ABC-type phosphate transport system substrate-binding protein
MKTFKYIVKTSLLIALICLLSTSLHAESKGVVVVSKDVKIDKLSKNELESIFLGKTTIWEDGKRIQVGLSTDDAQTTEHFLKNFIGKNQRRFKKYWLKLVFAGYGIAPKFFKDDMKAISYTQRQDGVIAFISNADKSTLEGLKIISVND